jgi:hypothetical protein
MSSGEGIPFMAGGTTRAAVIHLEYIRHTGV